MGIELIRLKNFTVFNDFKLNLSSGVNIFIGENGTGKTHLLKAIYSACETTKSYGDVKYHYDYSILNKCFNVNSGKFTLLRNPNQPLATIELKLYEDSGYATVRTNDVNSLTGETFVYEIIFPQVDLNAVLIPVKDMLTHSKGLLAMASKYRDFPFDKTFTDIIVKASQWKLKKVPKLAESIIPLLEEMIEGQVTFENEEFYVQKKDGRKVNFAVEAEGLKKIGLLWQLLMTESITENSILLWDEPEANLNPRFLPKLVECLLELSRHNVQIFISTHNYIFAKYFNVRAKSTDQILFHSLYFQDGSVTAESNKVFSSLKNNAIVSTFNELLDEVYDLNMGD